MSYSVERQHDKNDIAAMLSITTVRAGVDAGLIELARAKRIHPDWPVCQIRQMAIMNVEAGEAQKALNKVAEMAETLKSLQSTPNTPRWTREAWPEDPFGEVRQEVIQTLSMCLRVLENIEKLELEKL